MTPAEDPIQRGLAASASGDANARDELFGASMPALRAFLRAKVGGELAVRESVDDLAQSVCREVLRDLDELSFADADQFRAYLFLQATRKVVDRYRYHRRDKRDVARLRRMPSATDGQNELVGQDQLTPSRVVGAREELDRIEAALQHLPEAQRDAVLLSRLAGLDYAEIARQKNTTESAVRGLVARGLARLSGLLAEPGE